MFWRSHFKGALRSRQSISKNPEQSDDTSLGSCPRSHVAGISYAVAVVSYTYRRHVSLWVVEHTDFNQRQHEHEHFLLLFLKYYGYCVVFDEAHPTGHNCCCLNVRLPQQHQSLLYYLARNSTESSMGFAYLVGSCCRVEMWSCFLFCFLQTLTSQRRTNH